MKAEHDAIIAELSVRLFDVSPEEVDDAETASRGRDDWSLVDELVSRGHLSPRNGGVLGALYQQLRHHEAATQAHDAHGNEADEPAADEKTGVDPDAALPFGDAIAADQADRYQIRAEHARGGMGRILVVWDHHMQREVALKEIRPARNDKPEQAARERTLARFLREAQVTGRLQHPSIIPVHEIGERADGTLYYTMKFVRGRTLRQAIQDATNLEARMALLPHYVDLCQAVAYAHAHGVIHRDIKPSNVMIGEFGETLVIDWGLAKEIGRADPEAAGVPPGGGTPPPMADLTMDGQLLGTPHYMSPEQATGKHDTLDARSDVYSLGAVLYELLTGNRPYRDSTGVEVLRMAAAKPPDPPEALCPQAPPALAAICHRAMAREPDARYPSAESLAQEINKFQAGALVDAYRYRPSELLGRFIRRHRREVAITAVAAVLLVGLACFSYLRLQARYDAEQKLRVAAERERYDLSVALAQRGIEEFHYDQARSLLDRAPYTYRGWVWGRLSHVIQSVRQLIGHSDEAIWNAAVTPNGRYAGTYGPANVLKIWDLETGACLRKMPVEGADLRGIAVHPSGAEIASSDTDGVVTRWDLDTGAAIAVHPIVDGRVDALAYSPDGAYLAAGSTKVTLLNLNQGAKERRLEEPEGTVNTVAFSNDNRWLAAGDSTGTVYVWDLESGALADRETAHTNNRQTGVQGVHSLGFSDDATLIASGGSDAIAIIWRRDGLDRLHTLTSHMKRIHNLAFTPGGNVLFTDSEGDVKRWDVKTGDELPSWIRLNGTSRCMLLPPGKESLLTVESQGTINRWSLAPAFDGVYLTGHTEEVNAVRFSADGRYLISSGGHWKTGGDDRVLVWDLGEDGRRQPEAPWRVLEGGEHWVRPLAFHPEERLVSSGDANGHLLTWDWRAGTLESVRQVPEYEHGLRCIAYHPEGHRVVTAGWAEDYLTDATEWDTATGERTGVFRGETDIIDSLAYSPDGTLLAAATRDGVAILWDTATRERVHTLESDLGWVYAVAFSPDGQTLATTHGHLPVRLWDVETGKLIRQLEGLHDRGNAITFSPDGKRVCSSDMGQTKVWNVETGATLLTLPHGAMDVAFSPDGRSLATAGVDGRVGLWHTVDWRAGPSAADSGSPAAETP